MSTHHPSFGRSSGFGNVFKSWTSSLKTPSSKTVPVQINPTVVGGGSEQYKLFMQLQNGPLPQRASTAVQMTESLKKFTISSIPEIWYLARDMCNPKVQSYIRRIALKLMIECIKNDDLTSTSIALMYYRDICSFCQLTDYKVDQEFDLFLSALRSLTHDGRDIHELCLNEGLSLPHFLETSLTALGKNAKNFTSKQTENDLKEDINFQNLVRLLSLIKNCIRFNPYSMEEHQIMKFAKKAIQISLNTTNNEILVLCIELLSATVIFTSIQQQYLYDVLKFLCSVYGSNDQLTELTWNAITVLCSQAAFPLVKGCLEEILTNEAVTSFKSSEPENALSAVKSNTTTSTLEHKESNSALSSCVGAIQIIERLAAFPSVFSSNEVVLVHFLPSLITMTTFNVPVLNSTVLRSLDRLFSQQAYVDQNEFNVNSIMEQIYLFQIWYSTRCSIYDLLNNIKIFNDLDISYWKSICYSLQKAYESHELYTSQEKLVSLFTRNYQYLPTEVIKFVLRYYADEKLLTVLNPFSQENTLKILNYFYYNTKNHESDIAVNEDLGSIKIEVLRTIKHSLDVSYVMVRNDFTFEIVIDIIKKSIQETNPSVLHYLINDIFVSSGIKTSYSTLKSILDTLIPHFETRKSGRLKSYVSLPSSGIRSSQASIESGLGNMSNAFKLELAKGVIKLLIIELTEDAQKALEVYRFCIFIAQYALTIENTDLLLIILKGFVRIRVSKENNIYFTNPSDMEGLATAFGRNASDLDFQNSNYKWTYPDEIDYIDERFYDRPLPNLKLFDANSSSLQIESDEYTIDVEPYISIALDIMTYFVDWEVYSFIYGHFCTQMANIQLLMNNKEQILRLKKILCELLTLNLPSTVNLPEGFTRAHLQVAYVRTHSSLMGYRQLFSKADEDDIIRSLLIGIDSWEKTAIPAVHMLTACCYEMPSSVKKCLSTILVKLQTRTTSIFASSHILEFLMSLINIPSLTSSLNIDDVRRIFGICFKFILYSSDAIKNKSSNEGEKDLVPQHGINAVIDQTPSTQGFQEHSSVLLQYVLILSYNVISTWFLRLDLRVRRSLSAFILRNLVSVNTNNSELDDQVIGIIDLIRKFTYSDLPLKMVNPKTILDQMKSDGPVTIQNWVVGYSTLTIAYIESSANCVAILRGPTGVTVLRINLDASMLTKEVKFTNKRIFTPSYMLLQITNTFNPGSDKPIPLLEDSLTLRALSTLDRIPVVEFHKIGLVYIGRNQTQETEILSNRGGSKSYQKFLDSIGKLIKLKGCKDIYVGGLDTDKGTDGEFALYWSDKTVQVIYHATSLMPNIENDTYLESKKRHIGNNYVNIYFDESGHPFNFNIIKSQFNFINIVISPHTKPFDSYTEQEDGPKFFKVKLLRRNGVPAVFSTCHFKIISQEHLPYVIRNLAISASQFANVWHANYHDKFASNWTHRVRLIKTLKQRAIESHESLKKEQLQDQDTNFNDATKSFLEQLEFDSIEDNNDTTPKYEYLTDRDNELYSMIEFNSFT